MKLNRLLAISLLASAIAACSSDTPPLPAPQVQEVITVDQTLYYNSVWFEHNSAAIPDDFNSILALNADYLISNPMAQVQIQGNASEAGSPQHNQKLALARAKTVKERLIAVGVNPAQIQVISFGADRPLFPDDKKGNSPKNRRADIIYISGAPLTYHIETLPLLVTEDESVDFDPISIKTRKQTIKSVSSATTIIASAPVASSPITTGIPVSTDASAPSLILSQ